MMIDPKLFLGAVGLLVTLVTAVIAIGIAYGKKQIEDNYQNKEIQGLRNDLKNRLSDVEARIENNYREMLGYVTKQEFDAYRKRNEEARRELSQLIEKSFNTLSGQIKELGEETTKALYSMNLAISSVNKTVAVLESFKDQCLSGRLKT